MKERRVQIDRIVVAASLFANVKHSGAAQISDQAPHSSVCQSHCVRNFVGSAVRVDGNMEEDGAVTGYEIKGSHEMPLWNGFIEGYYQTSEHNMMT